MSFRLWTIFYVFALTAAAMATFGPSGILTAALVLGIWTWVWYAPNKPRRPRLLDVVVAIFIVCVLLALLLPSVQSARGAARRNQCMNQLKQIVIALLNYHDTKGAFPPAFVADANGKPMHSWRVLILPFIEEPVLYRKYNLSEPWDGPNNNKLASQIPEVYRCPAQVDQAAKLETNYFAIVSPETGWGRSIGQFKDGTSKTIMVIEATGLGVNWMEPHDVTLEEAIELLTTKKRSGHWHVDDGFLTTTYYETSFRNVAYCDGHTEWIGQLTDPAVARALFTAAGGERFDFYDGQTQPSLVDPKTTTVVKWGKVWGLSVFVALSLLPAAWLKRKPTKADGSAPRELGDAGEQQVGVAADG